MVAATLGSERIKRHNQAHSKIKKMAREAGLYKADYLYYVVYASTLIVLVVLSLHWLTATESALVWMGIAIGMAGLHTHLSYIAHDAGHLQVFPTWPMGNEYVSLALCFAVGLGPSWWKYTHDAHHRDPNDIESDPNVRVDPFLVFSRVQWLQRSPLWQWVCRHQVWYYIVLVAFETLAMTLNSFEFLLSSKKKGVRTKYCHHRWLELLLLSAHFVTYFVFLWLVMGLWMVPFVLLHKIPQGLYLGAVFAPNHKGMDVIDDDAKRQLSYLERQVVTTRDVFPGWLGITTFLSGGLNYQTAHHVLPNVPRRRLRQLDALIVPVLEGVGLSRCVMSFRASFGEIRRYFTRVGHGKEHVPESVGRAA